MEVKPLGEIVDHWSHRAFGYIFTYVGGGPRRDEGQDWRWVVGTLGRFSADDIREAIVQNKGWGDSKRWLALANAYGVKSE